MPASPASRTTCAAPPPFETRRHAASIRASSVSRPTNVVRSARSSRTGNDAGAAATPPRSSSANCCVSREGPVRSRVTRRLRSSVYSASAAPRSPAASSRAHQRPMDLLGERLERSLTPRQGDGAAQIAVTCRGRSQLLEQRDEAFAVLVLRRQRPLLVEAGQEGAIAERERVVAASLGAQAFGFEHVDPRVRRHADAIACGDERPLAERAAEGPQRTPETGPRALVEHVGPEDRGDGRSGLEAGAKRQPREQRARPTGRRGRLRRRPPRRSRRPVAAAASSKRNAPGLTLH